MDEFFKGVSVESRDVEALSCLTPYLERGKLMDEDHFFSVITHAFTTSGTGEMAQLAVYLGPEYDFQISWNKLDMVVCAGNPSRARDRQIPGACWPDSLAYLEF